MKHYHVLEDYDRGRKVMVATTDHSFDWGQWMRLNRNAMEAAEEFTKADPQKQMLLREFLDSLGIKVG